MRTTEQEAALRAIAAWLRPDDRRQVFRLFGYAGTGKTSLARTIAEGVDGDVAFCAFTGKAAHVLRQKGCVDATTIHGLIYRPCVDEGGRPAYIRNPDSRVSRASLVVLDEASMVDAVLGTDLLSFGTKVLVLGDPHQLPPVEGPGLFTQGVGPDFELREVHRQRADNPVIHLSTVVRNGGRLQPGRYGESRVIADIDLREGHMLAADQVLVEGNRARRDTNVLMRHILGRRSPFPEVGESLVCLRNHHKRGLTNGAKYVVESLDGRRGRQVDLGVRPEDEEARDPLRISVNPGSFGKQDSDAPSRDGCDRFDYGYALTAHKAQGSQWGSVVVRGDGRTFRGEAGRWLYTAITRAVDRVTVAI